MHAAHDRLASAAMKLCILCPGDRPTIDPITTDTLDLAWKEKLSAVKAQADTVRNGFRAVVDGWTR